MELPPVDRQPQAPDTLKMFVPVGIEGRKLSTAKTIPQFLQAPVASFVCEVFSFSTVKVRVLAPPNSTACLFLSLQFSLIVELLFSNIVKVRNE